jgi:hypothetical protein
VKKWEVVFAAALFCEESPNLSAFSRPSLIWSAIPRNSSDYLHFDLEKGYSIAWQSMQGVDDLFDVELHVTLPLDALVIALGATRQTAAFVCLNDWLYLRPLPTSTSHFVKDLVSCNSTSAALVMDFLQYCCWSFAD